VSQRSQSCGEFGYAVERKVFTMRISSILKMAAAGSMAVAVFAAQGTALAQDTVLKPPDVQKLLPASVYYKGQSAPTQLRNSGGVRFADGAFVLATLVDTSGYASDVAARYQAYFITEVPIKVGGANLPAGVYGVGFVGGNKFVVTDVGAHELLKVTSGEDTGLKRPMPLWVDASPEGGFRLYSGRRFVTISR
jgi:hypothetical protein